MNEIMRLRSAFPFFDETSIQGILKDIESTLKSGALIEGPHVREFETEFARYTGSKHAVAVNSGTSALEVMLRFLNIAGRDVIVPTNTFVATATAVLLAGGKPVFADIDENTLCFDLDDVEKRVTSKTMGVIAVHIAGLISPRMKELRSFCEENKLFLLEDAAHAHGASIDGDMAGSLCDGGAFSFYPTKVMTTGHGGMITTNDSNMDAIARNMRDHGLNSERLMTMVGGNWCMSQVTAIIGKYQLKNLESFVLKRNEIAKLYEKHLKQTEGISLFKTPSNIRHSYYKYPIKLNDDVDAQKLARSLRDRYGIETGNIYYPPCHLHPFYRETLGMHEGYAPVAEKVLGKVLCLPMHVCITDNQVRYITEALDNSIGGI